MSLLLFETIQDRQPTDCVVESSKYHLFQAFETSLTQNEVVSGKSGTILGTPLLVSTPIGKAAKFVNGQAWKGQNSLSATNFPYTLICAFRIDSLAAAARVFQSGASSNYAGINFWVQPNGSGSISYGNNTGIASGTPNFQLTFPAGTFVTGVDYFVAASIESLSITAAVNGNTVAGTTLSGSSATIVTVDFPYIGRLNYAGGTYYSYISVYFVALANYASNSSELSLLTANPWQVFEPDVDYLWIPDSISAPVPGGSLAATEAGTDVASVTGGVLASASLAAVESGLDTAALSASAPVASATGTIAASEASADTAAFTGAALSQGTLTAQDAATDSAALSAWALAQGTLAATEASADIATVSGAGVAASATMTATEASVDTVALTGAALVQGLIAAAETGTDTVYLAGQVYVLGAVAAVESSADVCALRESVLAVYISGAMTRSARLQSGTRSARLQSGTRSAR